MASFLKQHKIGYLLFEVLVAVALIIGVATFAVQALNVGGRGAAGSDKQTIAAGLLAEEILAVKSIASTDWDNVYTLGRGEASLYHSVITAENSWATSTGTEEITSGGTTYTRSFYVSDVFRNDSDRVVSSGLLDPSTLKVVATVTWPGGGTLSDSSIITRWANKVTSENDWSSQVGYGVTTEGGAIQLAPTN